MKKPSVVSRDNKAVFLNIPFDESYERIFVGLISALLSLGRKPRCVLEIAELGQGRLNRVIEVIGSCRVSFHDLSRVGTPVRFNMPFELGIAFALKQYNPPHDFVMLDKIEHRLDVTLSDLSGIDPRIHRGSMDGAVECVLESLCSETGFPETNDVRKMARDLWKLAYVLKEKARKSLFNRHLFFQLIEMGIKLAVGNGFIAE